MAIRASLGLSVLVVLSALFVLIETSVQDQAAAAEPGTEPWIVDTDMAFDDALALLLALGHPRTDLVAITVAGTGTGRCPAAARQALSLVAFATDGQRDIPIACGPGFPLDGYHAQPPAWRNETDIAEFNALPPSTSQPEPRGAVELLVDTLRAAAQPVSILSIAPQTNIALAFDTAPDVIPKVREIVMMGGAVHAAGNVGVPGVSDLPINTRSEWNLFIDPVASSIVFESGVPIRVVPLDATRYAPVNNDLIAVITADTNTAAAQWAHSVMEAMVASGLSSFWDPLTATVALDRAVCDYHMAAIAIGIETAEDGWSFPGTAADFPADNWQGEPRRHLATDTAGAMSVDTDRGNWVLVCSRPNIAAFADRFRRSLSTLGR